MSKSSHYFEKTGGLGDWKDLFTIHKNTSNFVLMQEVRLSKFETLAQLPILLGIIIEVIASELRI